MDWRKNPKSKRAPKALTAEIRAVVTGERKPRTKTAEVRIEYDTFQRTAQIGVVVDEALAYQAGEIGKSGLYAHHPKQFGRPSDLIYDALKGVRPGSSEWSDLSFLAEKLVPYLDAHKIPNREKLFRKGTLSKSRRAANYLRPLLNQPPATVRPVVEAVIRDVVDDKLPVAQFSQRYTRKPRSITVPACQVEHFIIVACRDDADEKRIKTALAKKVAWNLAATKVLCQLSTLAVKAGK